MPFPPKAIGKVERLGVRTENGKPLCMVRNGDKVTSDRMLDRNFPCPGLKGSWYTALATKFCGISNTEMERKRSSRLGRNQFWKLEKSMVLSIVLLQV